jgi:hypothetical protein
VLTVALKNQGTHFLSYDGNGNVAGLSAATDGTETGRFEYGPFGETIRVPSPLPAFGVGTFSTTSLI